MTVLLLDSTYEPLKVISWTKALGMVFSGKAEIIEEKSDSFIRSPSKVFKMPSVIRQFNKFKKLGAVQFSRVNVYLRDDWTCQYCNKKKQPKELTFDHVVPRCKGGKTTWTNIVTACRPCNLKKASLTLEQSGLRLIKPPKQPTWLPPYISVKLINLPEEWNSYLECSGALTTD